MPIRFRCAYCQQLMGISKRKAGAVVRCPKCAGQVVVPPLVEKSSPHSKRRRSRRQGRGVNLFEQFDVEPATSNEKATTPAEKAPRVDQAHLAQPTPHRKRGFHITPGMLIVVIVVGAVALAGAFVAGYMVGR